MEYLELNDLGKLFRTIYEASKTSEAAPGHAVDVHFTFRCLDPTHLLLPDIPS